MPQGFASGDSRPRPNLSTTVLMALHIRDFRQSDAAGFSRLGAVARRLGAPPAHLADTRILTGLRGGRLTAAIWFRLEGPVGRIPTIIVARTGFWQSDVQELVAEASLWLASRGAARIELSAIPQDKDLLAALLDMQFEPGEHAGVLRRRLPARSAA